MSKQIIYLDNAATTKLDETVLKAMMPFFKESYGNPSSIHQKGLEAYDAVQQARQRIANSIQASPQEIYFTSGGSEANNFALKGIAFANKEKGKHIITTKVEHKSVLDTCAWLEKQGFDITYLDVDKDGFVSPKTLEQAIRKDTIVVSIIHGNNEIGTIQNLKELGAICAKNEVYFHSDACQSYMKTPISVTQQALSTVSLNAHKLHGPKGIGALYIRKGTNIDPLIHGGGQERGMRGGTENVPLIVGFGEAVHNYDESDNTHMQELRDTLINGVLSTIPGVTLNGPQGEQRLVNNINFSFQAIEGEAIGGLLDQAYICSSTGSACSSASLDASYVLKAIGLSHEQANGSLRISLSKYTTQKDIQKVLQELPLIVTKLRKISPFGTQVPNTTTRNTTKQ